MLSYSKIIKQAYYLTLHNKVLWFFGLFLVGTFNLSFFNFSPSKIELSLTKQGIYERLTYFSEHPALLFTLSGSILIFSIGGLILTNWSKIMLVLGINSLLTNKFWFLNKHEAKLSLKYLWPIIKISLFTTSLMLLVAAALFVPSFTLLRNLEEQNLLVTLGVVLFVPLAFIISCINIFTSFFVILTKRNMGTSLELATDLVASKWMEILSLTIILVIIYAGVFASGVAVVYICRILLTSLLEIGIGFKNSNFSAIIMTSRFLGGLIIWALLSGLNVFFNAALQLLFGELIKPMKNEEKAAVEVAPITV